MATWTQYTYEGGELKSTIKRTADDMVKLMAQMHFLKQDGEDIEVGIESTDDMFRVTCYTIHRQFKGKKLYYRFERQ